jgi:hypothetical protein
VLCAGDQNECEGDGMACSQAFGRCVVVDDRDCGSESVSTLGQWPMARYCATGIGRGPYDVQASNAAGARMSSTFSASGGDFLVSAPVVTTTGEVLVLGASGKLWCLDPVAGMNGRALRELDLINAGASDPTADDAASLTIISRDDVDSKHTTIVLAVTTQGALRQMKLIYSGTELQGAGINTFGPTQAEFDALPRTDVKYRPGPVVAGGNVWLLADARDSKDAPVGVLAVVDVDDKGSRLARLDDPPGAGLAVFQDATSSHFAFGAGQVFFGGVVAGNAPLVATVIAKIDAVGTPTDPDDLLPAPLLLKPAKEIHALLVHSGRLFEVPLDGKTSVPPTSISLPSGATAVHPPALRSDGRLVLSGLTGSGGGGARFTLTRTADGLSFDAVVEPLPNAGAVYPTILGTWREGGIPAGESLLTPFFYTSNLDRSVRVSATSEAGALQWSGKAQTFDQTPEQPPARKLRGLAPAIGKGGTIYFTGTDGNLHEFAPPAP